MLAAISLDVYIYPSRKIRGNNRFKPLRGSMKRLSKSLTKRAPVRCGSIKNIGITELDKIEYRQTGMIRIKETPVSRGEVQRSHYHDDIGYYDYVESQRNWLEDIFNS